MVDKDYSPSHQCTLATSSCISASGVHSPIAFSSLCPGCLQSLDRRGTRMDLPLRETPQKDETQRWGCHWDLFAGMVRDSKESVRDIRKVWEIAHLEIFQLSCYSPCLKFRDTAASAVGSVRCLVGGCLALCCGGKRRVSSWCTKTRPSLLTLPSASAGRHVEDGVRRRATRR